MNMHTTPGVSAKHGKGPTNTLQSVASMWASALRKGMLNK
jgi:hypothetical protein